VNLSRPATIFNKIFALRKKLGINKSTLFYMKKNLEDGKSIKFYNKTLTKVIN
jgi:predicted transcriptional regulator